MTDEEKIALYQDRIATIETVLAGKASDDIKQYEINGKNIERYSMSELISLINYFKGEIATLIRKTRPRKIFTRFTN